MVANKWGLYDTGVREKEVWGERVKDARRICRGVKSFFVLDALETAEIATIRPSFRGKERLSVCVWVREGEGRGGGTRLWYFWPTELVAVGEILQKHCVYFAQAFVVQPSSDPSVDTDKLWVSLLHLQCWSDHQTDHTRCMMQYEGCKVDKPTAHLKAT